MLGEGPRVSMQMHLQREGAARGSHDPPTPSTHCKATLVCRASLSPPPPPSHLCAKEDAWPKGW